MFQIPRIKGSWWALCRWKNNWWLRCWKYWTPTWIWSHRFERWCDESVNKWNCWDVSYGEVFEDLRQKFKQKRKFAFHFTCIAYEIPTNFQRSLNTAFPTNKKGFESPTSTNWIIRLQFERHFLRACDVTGKKCVYLENRVKWRRYK